MKNLKILIWLPDNDAESFNQTLNVLDSRYGIERFEIVGVVGKDEASFQGKKLNNIPLESVPNVSSDYVIVSGKGSDISDSPLPARVIQKRKKILAEQIGTSSESIVFDFEIDNKWFSFPKVCLVIIFNHRYDQNLPLLRKIYGKRFSEIRFLMPFYDGTDSDVIPVYESSYQFQGFLIQAYNKLKNIPCTHYLFVADDLIIHPDFNEINFITQTDIQNKKFLTSTFSPLNSPSRFSWYWAGGSSKPFYDRSTQWRSSIYTYDEAMAKFKDFFGVEYKEVYDKDFFGDPNKPGSTVFGRWNNAEEHSKVVAEFIKSNGGSSKIPCPMASRGGGADIFCVDKGSLFEFSRLCGIFSAMNMFVEIAIPTAVVLTYKRDEVQFFPAASTKFLWGNARTDFENKYDKDFNRLYNEWEENILFVHPVKLSRWKNV